MRYFTTLVEQSLSRTREATLSILGINDAGLRQHLSDSMSDTLGDEGCFLAQPLFEHTFGWEAADVTFGVLENNLLSSTCLKTLASAGSYAFKPSDTPYKHQTHAWRTLLSDTPSSAVITTGTGSGKTECFMVPILDDLIREHEVAKEPLIGVRALFLYPLNALINSQKERLDAWTKPFGENIRYCLYNGNTPENDNVNIRQTLKKHPNRQLSRTSLRDAPAPILLTNATMLEYMLVRQVDNPILQKSKEAGTLRWIVLDEAHTYIGSQAAELSLLLRRVVQAFGKQSKDIRFVATSATIADDKANEKLQDYLAGLAGVNREQVTVIGGKRVWPKLPALPPKEISLSSLEAIDRGQGVSAARFKALQEHPVATTLRDMITSKNAPQTIDALLSAVSSHLAGKHKAEQQKEVLQWLDLLTGTQHPERQEPFLKRGFRRLADEK